MAADKSSWRTATFRQSVVAKIDEAIQSSGIPTSKNSMEMENHVFQKAKSKEEYLGFIARLILHIQEMNAKKRGGAGPAAEDAIKALQNLAIQETGNQTVGIGGPSQGGGMVQLPSNTASNVLQSLDRPQGVQEPGMQPLQGEMGPDMGMGPGPQQGGDNMMVPGQAAGFPPSNVNTTEFPQQGPLPSAPSPADQGTAGSR